MQVGPEQAEAYLNALGLSGMVRTMLVLLPLTHLHMLRLHACMLMRTVSILLIRLCLFLQCSDQTLAASQQRSGYLNSCSCAQALMQLSSASYSLLCLTLQGPFPFHPPTGVAIIGSSAQQSLAKPNLVIDVAVTIPKACFYEKDHLDCKYHGKRALWLTVVAAQLKKDAVLKQQEWVLLNNDARYAACCLQCSPATP
jgi:hypothetical protein